MQRIAILATWYGSIAVVIFLSLNPGQEVPMEFWNADKVYHLLAYAWLGLLPALAYPRGRTLLFCGLAMLVLGGGIEVVQSMIPERMGSVADMLANALGVGLGLVLGLRGRARFASLLGVAEVGHD